MGVISNGTTLIDNGALDPAVPAGSLILLSTQTASASATISFTSGIDSTYDSYVFKFIDINPATDNTEFLFNMSTDAGANYNVTKTTTFFRAFHDEADTTASLGYLTSYDLAQSTSFQPLTYSSGNGADESSSGTLQIFNPSSTTFVKHFIATVNDYSYDSFSVNIFVAGYGNTTSAVNAIQFKMLSGNFDGIIKMYGVK
jgi:hypothetical protein